MAADAKGFLTALPWHGRGAALGTVGLDYEVISNLALLAFGAEVVRYYAPRKPKVPRVPNKRKRMMHKRVDCDW